VVDHLRTRFRGKADIGIACVYCNYKENDAVKLVAGLWRQLVRDRDLLSQDVKDLYERSNRRDIPNIRDVSKVLLSEIRTYSKIFVVVDALDECPEEGNSRATLLSELRNLPPEVHLMVTSRPLATIESCFPGSKQLEIKASREDIRRFINGRISFYPTLACYVEENEELREYIVNTVTQKAEGMYVLLPLFGTCEVFLTAFQGSCCLSFIWNHWQLRFLPKLSDKRSKLYRVM
jgi:hypothetical protein